MQTLSELRKKIIEDIEKLSDDKLSTEKAKTICQQVQTVINLTRLEMDYWASCEVALPFVENDETDDGLQKMIEEKNKKPYEFGK